MIPDEVSEQRVRGFGDNSGSLFMVAKQEQAAALYDVARESGKTFAQRRSEFLASAAAQCVRDRQSAADAADTIKLAGEVWALIDADRRARSDPFRETHLALSASASEFWAPVSDAMAVLRDQIDAWTAQEDSRIAAQKAEQEAAMASWVAPTVPATAPGRAAIDYSAPTTPPRSAAPAMREPRRSKIRGDLGSTISARAVVTYEIEDISLIPDHIMQSPTVVEAILTVVRSTARHMGVPAGVRVITGTGNQIR